MTTHSPTPRWIAGSVSPWGATHAIDPDNYSAACGRLDTYPDGVADLGPNLSHVSCMNCVRWLKARGYISINRGES